MNRIMLLAAVACVVSPGVAQRVRVDYDHGSSFSRYKTYCWGQAPDSQLAGTPWPAALFPNQLMQERIVSFVEEALGARRLKRVEKGCDLLIGYLVTVTEQQQYTTVGSGWGWDGGISTTTEQTLLRSTLVINMTDARTKQLVFQGVSNQSISSRPAKNTKKLQKAVNEIFEKYPPRL